MNDSDGDRDSGYDCRYNADGTLIKDLCICTGCERISVEDLTDDAGHCGCCQAQETKSDNLEQ